METSDVPGDATVRSRQLANNSDKQCFIPLRLEIFKTMTIGGSEDLPQYKSEHQRQNK